jgi:hypothetical protein
MHISKTFNWQTEVFAAVVNYLNIGCCNLPGCVTIHFRNVREYLCSLYIIYFFYRYEVRTAGYQGRAVRTDKEIQDATRQHATVFGLRDRSGIKNRNEIETGT